MSKGNLDVVDVTSLEPPYTSVEEFDYANIAKEIETDEADIIWIALGAPEQEYFTSRLESRLKRRVTIAIGAAFKSYSNVEARRASKWVIKWHLGFVYKIFREPKRQSERYGMILFTPPKLLLRGTE